MAENNKQLYWGIWYMRQHTQVLQKLEKSLHMISDELLIFSGTCKVILSDN